jgi:hypothetical protein
MFAVSAPRCATAPPPARAASTLGSKRAIAAAPLRVHRARRASAVNVTARAAGTIEKVTKDELETVMQVRVARCRTPSVSRLVNPRFTLNPVRKRKKAPFPNVDVGRARDATRSRLTTLDTLSSRFPSHVVVSPRCHASRAS